MRGFVQFAKASVLLCAWLGFCGQACAQEKATQNADVYIGSLAGKDIVLTFSNSLPDTNGNLSEEQIATIKARYFYRKFGKIIPIVAQANGLLVECTQTFHELACDKPTGYWSFAVPKQASEANISAQWRATPAGAAQQVSLTPVVADSSSKLDPWTKLLGSGPTKLTGIKSMNGVSAGILVDIRSGAKVPQLVSGYPDEVKNAFNSKMAVGLVSESAAFLENQSLDGAEYNDSAIQYASPVLVTTGGSSGGYYGGNHGLDVYSSVSYDIASGARIDLRSTFFRHVTLNDYEKFKDKWGRAEIPRKHLKQHRLIEDLVLKEIEKFPSNKVPFANKMATLYQSNKDCFEEWQEHTLNGYGDETAPLGVSKWNENLSISAFELMPTQAGLAVYTNNFPEANRSCRNVMLVIPWKKVQPYITKSLNNE